MKMLTKTAAVCTLVVMSGSAAALPTDFTFNIGFDSGGPSSVPVYVTLDGVTGTGIEVFRPNLSNLLKFEFTVFGTTFKETDDTSFPSLPFIQLEEGLLTGVNYGGRQSILGGRITTSANIRLDSQVNSISYARVGPGIFNFAVGDVAPTTWRSLNPPTPVPASATLALFALGLTGLGIHRRKKASC